MESLTADEYEDDLFEMKSLDRFNDLQTDTATPLKPIVAGGNQDLERLLSLADAYIVRNDMDKAAETLKDGERYFWQPPEVMKRFKLVHQRSQEREEIPLENRPNRSKDKLDGKIEYLRGLLDHMTQIPVYIRPRFHYS